MKKNAYLMVVPALFALGCTSPTTTNDDMAGDMAKAATPDMAMIPAAPMLGAQMERMGRPTINVAVTNPFNLMEGGKNQDMIRDAYNADSDPSKWVANWSAILQGNLAIYDGADATCGNQLAAGPMPIKGRYQGLGDILADDRLWLDTTVTVCVQYLGVEAAALMLPIKDCGGRTLAEDVVDETYTSATAGIAGFKADGTFAVTDGIAKDLDGTASITFPFLGAPN